MALLSPVVRLASMVSMLLAIIGASESSLIASAIPLLDERLGDRLLGVEAKPRFLSEMVFDKLNEHG